MTKYAILVSVLALLIGIGSGYWLAGKQHPVENVASVAERKPLYYRHPMNPKVTSPTPTKDEMGMDYLPVYADETSQTAQPNKGRILYYRHPMGAADTSPVPKKDEMGMDYLVEDIALEINFNIQLGEASAGLGDVKKKESYFLKAEQLLKGKK